MWNLLYPQWWFFERKIKTFSKTLNCKMNNCAPCDRLWKCMRISLNMNWVKHRCQFPPSVAVVGPNYLNLSTLPTKSFLHVTSAFAQTNSFTMKMERVCSSETSEHLFIITRGRHPKEFHHMKCHLLTFAFLVLGKLKETRLVTCWKRSLRLGDM